MRRELLLLREMRDAAMTIRGLVGDRSAEQVEADALRRSALLWHFTVLGEAASQVPASVKDSQPAIAWRAATIAELQEAEPSTGTADRLRSAVGRTWQARARPPRR